VIKTVGSHGVSFLTKPFHCNVMPRFEFKRAVWIMIGAVVAMIAFLAVIAIATKYGVWGLAAGSSLFTAAGIIMGRAIFEKECNYESPIVRYIRGYVPGDVAREYARTIEVILPTEIKMAVERMRVGQAGGS